MQSVHLQHDASFTSGLHMLNLPMDHASQFRHHIEAGDQQMAECRSGQLPFQHRKHFVYIGYQFRIRSQQRHIGIDACRFFIEIAGTQIGKIPPLAAVFRIFPQNNRHFCMYFQTGNAIDDANTRLLHPFGRTHIVLFVETGFQLHKDRHLLPVLSSADQRIDNSRVLRHPVLRDFDLIYFRIKSRLHQEADQVVERLIGEMQQDIPFFHRPEDRAHLVQKRHTHGRRDLLLQFFSSWIRQFDQILQIVIPSSQYQIVCGNTKSIAYKRQEIIRHIAVIHKSA